MARKSSFQKSAQLTDKHLKFILMLEEYVRGELPFNSMLAVILQNFNVGPDYSKEIEVMLKDLVIENGAIDDLLDFIGILRDMEIRFVRKFDFVPQVPAEPAAPDPIPDSSLKKTVLKFFPRGRSFTHGSKGTIAAKK